LVLYLPFDVITSLKLKEDDEVGFFKTENRTFLFAKNSDITSMLQGNTRQEEPVRPKPAEAPAPRASVVGVQYQPSPDELSVLKKIDTIRYENRTLENTMKILNDSEKRVFQRLVAKSSVVPFKGKDGKEHYSIPKGIYDRFLMRKKPVAKEEPYNFVVPKAQAAPEDENVAELQNKGFIVLQTEAEASRVSLLLEQSIRHGQVLGTRSFSKNREFYILLRSYFDRYAQSILKKLREESYRVSDLARELEMSEDGARGILCILAENGDVMEKKKEVFQIA
jgi:uncharacterized protein YaaQ